MAVVQISRIQIRRGRTYGGTGLPQLASGELAWSVDTQELFIGNGSVAEGSPQVGNTKILTQNDLLTQGNLLNLAQVVYKVTNPTIVTGPDPYHPILRTVQTVLDDNANADQFGVKRNGFDDDTTSLQRAIDQLFLNPANKASSNNPFSIAERVVLNLLPGVYNIVGTIYIPSYATIIGAGIDKTIINYVGVNDGPVFQFVNDTSTIGHPSNINSTLGNNQPREIFIKGLTIINSVSISANGMQMDAVRDSIFEDIKINGNSDSSFMNGHYGIELNALSDIVTCENNKFKNITINGFTNAIYAKQDILNNTFENGFFYDLKQAVVLGMGANLSSPGEKFGPRQTHFINCKFYNVKQHAVYIDNGYDNFINDITLSNVGNDGAGVSSPIYPQIYFNVYGNNASHIISDRHNVLSLSDSTIRYIPEISGNGEYNMFSSKTLELSQITGYTNLLFLPVNTIDTGTPQGCITYTIPYFYKSTINNFTRKGIISISAETENGNIQLSDEYDFAGSGWSDTYLALDFKAYLVDESNNIYTNPLGQIPAAILIKYSNSLTNDAGLFHYTYKSFF